MNFSPMLKHGLDSFEHGLEHYLDGTERSRKFAILHIDQAIELFLKERIIQAGKSIYKSDGTTLSMHESFNSLKDIVKLDERPRLEELHDIRNSIQHKGFLPDNGTTKFFIEIAYEFTKQFLVDELKVLIDQVLTVQHRSLMEGATIIKETPNEIIDSFLIAKKLDSPVNIILSAYTILERAMTILPQVLNSKGRPMLKATLRNAAIENGVSKEKIDRQFKYVMMMRGMILQNHHEPTQNDAEGYINSVGKILDAIGINKSDLETSKGS